MKLSDAKKLLDKVIVKSRVHLYKPIQIAEILYRKRAIDDLIDLKNLETYRNESKRWRDVITSELIGRVCTSSAKFQDALFGEITPEALDVLAKENVRTKGGVETYIYRQVISKRSITQDVMNYCLTSAPAEFSVRRLIQLFWDEPGLRRSLDKIYEIVVYSLFITIINALELKITLRSNPKKQAILEEFEDFTNAVMKIDLRTDVFEQSAKVFRVGVTNAADRGLDMYANWGPVIQIKHLTLDEGMAENIVENIASDRIIIVCKKVEQAVLLSLLTQIGWKSKIQSVITEEELVVWYEKACRGKYSEELGKKLMGTLVEEMEKEFPSTGGISKPIQDRHYEQVKLFPPWS
jgi:type II restriction enzyme